MANIDNFRKDAIMLIYPDGTIKDVLIDTCGSTVGIILTNIKKIKS